MAGRYEMRGAWLVGLSAFLGLLKGQAGRPFEPADQSRLIAFPFFTRKTICLVDDIADIYPSLLLLFPGLSDIAGYSIGNVKLI